MKRLSDTMTGIAMLGTSNKPVSKNDFPSFIVNDLASEYASSEQMFLDALVLHFAYLDGGYEPIEMNDIGLSIPSPPTEVLPYAPQLFETLIAKVIQLSTIVRYRYMLRILDLLREKGMVLSPNYLIEMFELVKDEPYRREVMKAFGERGQWIDEMRQSIKEEVSLLDMKQADRLKKFVQLQTTEEALRFLQAIFVHETPVNKLAYLKVIRDHITRYDHELFVYLQTVIEASKSRSATQKKLEYFMTLLWLHVDSQKANTYFEPIVNTLWQKRQGLLKKGYALVDIAQQRILFEPLMLLEAPIYYNIPTYLSSDDQLIYFCLASIPTDRWCRALDISLHTWVEMVASLKIQVSSNSKIESFDFLTPLAINMRQYQDIELALTIFDFNQFESIGTDFLDHLDDTMFEKFFIKYAKEFKAHGINILALLSERTFVWSRAFTQAVMHYLFKNQYQDNNIAQAMWRISPFIHSAFMEMIPKDRLTQNLEDTLMEITQTKKLFDQCKGA